MIIYSHPKCTTCKKALKWLELHNTSGELYRKLGLKDVIKTMETSKAMELLASDGMLIKRPLLVSDEAVFFGFKEEQYEQLLKGGSND